jgi:hypothetical protein
VRNLGIQHEDETLRITTSIGLATLRMDESPKT